MPDLTPEILVYGFISYIVFLFSTTCHEAAHALVAKMGGDETAASGGQVSLNPIPHIQREPWGMVVFPIISFFLFNRLLAVRPVFVACFNFRASSNVPSFVPTCENTRLMASAWGWM